jgi:hypothetical protein
MSKAADLRYEGIRTRSGARLHQLRAVSPLRINPWVLQDPEWADASAIKGLIYDIYVTDDGTPVSATFTARIRVADPDGVGKTEVKIVADYRFRNVGRAVTITPPAGVCNTQAGA